MPPSLVKLAATKTGVIEETFSAHISFSFRFFSFSASNFCFFSALFSKALFRLAYSSRIFLTDLLCWVYSGFWRIYSVGFSYNVKLLRTPSLAVELWQFNFFLLFNPGLGFRFRLCFHPWSGFSPGLSFGNSISFSPLDQFFLFFLTLGWVWSLFAAAIFWVADVCC